MRQQAVVFGSGAHLVGLLTRPEQVDPTAPLVLLYNAGVLPRQGPHRMNVRIAQALADDGIASLRFDLSGQGDSAAQAAGGDFRAQAVADLRAAMDHAQATLGVQRFLLFGVCSGAVNAYDAALADERVAGLLMVDGLWFRSRWTTPMRHFKRARATGWRSSLAAIGRRLVARRAATPAAEPLFKETGDYGNPPRAEFVQAMNRLTARRASVFFLYGGSVLDYYSYAGQFGHVFGREAFFRGVRCEYHPDIDHTFVTRHAQQRMLAILRDWVGHQVRVPVQAAVA